MNSEWNIETDICEATGQGTVCCGLVHLGIFQDMESEFELKVLSNWRRSGAETYAFRFDIVTRDTTAQLLLKACVALGDLTGVDRILNSWLFRRQLLARYGASVPHLYYRNRGCLLEEFIRLPLADVLKQRNQPAARSRIVSELGRAMAIVAHLGFASLSLADIRSRGDDVVIIDFGEDLGPPGVFHRDHAGPVDEMLEILESCDGADDNDIRHAAKSFERKLAQLEES